MCAKTYVPENVVLSELKQRRAENNFINLISSKSIPYYRIKPFAGNFHTDACMTG